MVNRAAPAGPKNTAAASARAVLDSARLGSMPSPRGINSEGLKRRGFTAEQIRNIKNAYKVVYRQKLKLSVAIDELKSRVDEQPELKLFVDSLHTSDRGLLR